MTSNTHLNNHHSQNNANVMDARKYSVPSLNVPHHHGPMFRPNLDLNQVSLMEEQVASPHDDDIQSELPISPTGNDYLKTPPDHDSDEDDMYGAGHADMGSEFTKTPTGYSSNTGHHDHPPHIIDRFPHKDRHPPKALDLNTPDSDIYEPADKTPIGGFTNGMCGPPPPPMDAKKLSMDIAHDVAYV